MKTIAFNAFTLWVGLTLLTAETVAPSLHEVTIIVDPSASKVHFTMGATLHTALMVSIVF